MSGNKKKIWFSAEEWTNNDNHIQAAEIRVYARSDEKPPYLGSTKLLSIEYQRHKDEKTDQYTNFYAEKINDLSCYTEDVGQIYAILQKMKKYSDKIYSQGLTLAVYPINDEYLQRIALFKAIGATQIYIDRESREFSEVPVCA